MSTTVRVPVSFELPGGWVSVPPASGIGFVAVHPASRTSRCIANITVDGEYRPEVATLHEIAEAAVADLLGPGTEVSVGARREVGTADAPGVVQVVSIVTADGTDLVQYQTYLGLLDREDGRKRIVVKLVLTAAPQQAGLLTGDFQQLIASVRPV